MYDIAQAGRRLRSFTIVASVIATILALSVGAAFAQPTDTQKAEPAQATEKPTARTHPQNPELWDVEQMMEEAVLQISRRYNLNKAQENYTRMLLKERVRAFLDEYEDDVRQLLAESIRLQLRPGDATIEDFRKWAERAKPVYEAAQTAIYNGNDEWREILDEQQKKIHDQDLDQMRRNFDQVSRVMEQWEEGKGVAGSTSDRTNANGSTVVSRKAPPITKIQNIEDNWMMYVEKFIEVYHFDEKQANSARAKIHKEYHDKAVAYREQKKKEFEAVNAELSNPKFDKEHKDRPRQLLLQRRKLEQPIYTLFKQMDQRLLGLADSKQLAAANEAGKVELAKWKATFSGEKSDEKIRGNRGISNRPDPKPTTTAPASQPAATPPQKKDAPATVEDRPAAKPMPDSAAEDKPAPQRKAVTEEQPHEKAEPKTQQPAQKPADQKPTPKKVGAEKKPEPPAKS